MTTIIAVADLRPDTSYRALLARAMGVQTRPSYPPLSFDGSMYYTNCNPGGVRRQDTTLKLGKRCVCMRAPHCAAHQLTTSPIMLQHL